MVALWVPRDLLLALDAEVAREDSDRSKIIRRALRKKLRLPAAAYEEAA